MDISAVLIVYSRETSIHCHPQLKQIRGGHFEVTYIFIFCMGKNYTAIKPKKMLEELKILCLVSIKTTFKQVRKGLARSFVSKCCFWLQIPCYSLSILHQILWHLGQFFGYNFPFFFLEQESTVYSRPISENTGWRNSQGLSKLLKTEM